MALLRWLDMNLMIAGGGQKVGIRKEPKVNTSPTCIATTSN